MERPVKTVAEHRQILVDFLGGDLTVLLRSNYVCMSQNPVHTFDGAPCLKPALRIHDGPDGTIYSW